MRLRTVLISLMFASLAFARMEGARYLRWTEIQALLSGITTPAEKVPDVTDSKQWDSWIRQHDAEMRGGIDRCLEDSISLLIMYGTSFTKQPPLASRAEAVTPAGDLTPAARIRMDAFISGLDQIDDERFRSILQFLRRRQIAQDELRAFLIGNFRRAAFERRPAHQLHTGPTDSSSLEQSLRGLMTTGKAPAHIRRIAVLGPGLDPEFDPDTYNLWAGLDAALASGLTKPGNIEVIVFDINPWVLSYVRAVAANASGKNGARVRAEDLNVVTQTLDAAPGQGFDLVVAVTALAGYSRVEQRLAMASVAHMLAPGGVFLTNGSPPAAIPAGL
ncbi:MAG TPA: class I SAM-dependent methyltransferase [Bryobacteraceae bacterium]|nr:class I SAM-dependent methyltransferase [Bryobacteraceae bacterium]